MLFKKRRAKQIEDYVQDRLVASREVDLSYGKIPQEKVLDMVLASDLENLRMTLEETDRVAFDAAVETLLSARTIYVLGIRNCAPLASYLAFYLDQIFPHVHLLSSNGTQEIFEQLWHIGEQDVLIGISFPRYSMRTLKAMEFANDRKAHTISITDDIHSPLNLYSACRLIARSGMVTLVDSLTAPMSMLNALIVALCIRRQKEVGKHMEELETFWEGFQLYDRDELDQLAENTEISLIDPHKEEHD